MLKIKTGLFIAVNITLPYTIFLVKPALLDKKAMFKTEENFASRDIFFKKVYFIFLLYANITGSKDVLFIIRKTVIIFFHFA